MILYKTQFEHVDSVIKASNINLAEFVSKYGQFSRPKRKYIWT